MTDPQIIAVVSGKGGVGKTMLSVAIANELSRGRKTLLVDLDFFNRGLTGLLASLKSTVSFREIDAPQFLGDSAGEKWSLAEVRKNLFMVYYGDLEKFQSNVLEMRKIEALAIELKKYVDYLMKVSGCEFAVLDCHGGPDNTSFAACVMASRAVLVSEPDRITLHGTLNFLRTLQRESTVAPPDIRLAFNKVVAAFTSQFLFRFYDEFLRAEFGGKDLLAIYPLELFLTKAFEKMPFLTTAYPQSQLAIKTRLTLYELFKDVSPPVLPPYIAGMSRLERLIGKYYMGRWPGLLNLDFLLKVIAVCALVGVGLNLMLQELKERGIFVIITISKSDFETYLGVGLGLALGWVMAVLAFNWTREADTYMTYSFRTNAFVRAAVAAVTLVVLWLLPAALLGLLIHTAFTAGILYVMTMAVVTTVAAIPVGFYLRRGIRNIRFDRRYVEGGFRIVFSSALALLTIGAAIFG